MWCSFVCEAEKSDVQVCLYHCTVWESKPVTFQWHGRVVVSTSMSNTGLSIGRIGQTILSSCTILLMTSLKWVYSCQPLQTCHWLLGSQWLCGSITSLSKKCSRCLSFASGKSGCLVVVSVFAPPAVVCFKWYVLFQCSGFCFSMDVFSFWSARNTVPFFYFSSVISSDWRCTWYRSSSRYWSRMLVLFFLGTLEMVTRIVIQLGDFAATNCLSPGFHSTGKQMRSSRVFWNNSWLLDFATCSWSVCPHMPLECPNVSHW